MIIRNIDYRKKKLNRVISLLQIMMEKLKNVIKIDREIFRVLFQMYLVSRLEK
jgi:hypothetical protein